MDWGKYRQDVLRHVDCAKMDDVFRLVLTGSSEQLAQLRDWLETERCAGRLRYGTHASPSAILTCMVFDRNERHSHFIDGSDGGYALAAVELKSQAG